MNQPHTDPAAVLAMRQFLARVIAVPLVSVRVTGNPAADENTDVLKSYQVTEDAGKRTVILEKLDAVQAMEIDCILAGELDRLPNGSPDLARGASMFSQYVSERATLYP